MYIYICYIYIYTSYIFVYLYLIGGIMLTPECAGGCGGCVGGWVGRFDRFIFVIYLIGLRDSISTDTCTPNLK